MKQGSVVIHLHYFSMVNGVRGERKDKNINLSVLRSKPEEIKSSQNLLSKKILSTTYIHSYTWYDIKCNKYQSNRKKCCEL